MRSHETLVVASIEEVLKGPGVPIVSLFHYYLSMNWSIACFSWMFGIITLGSTSCLVHSSDFILAYLVTGSKAPFLLKCWAIALRS